MIACKQAIGKGRTIGNVGKNVKGVLEDSMTGNKEEGKREEGKEEEESEKERLANGDICAVTRYAFRLKDGC